MNYKDIAIIDIGSSSIKTFVINKENNISNIIGVGKSNTLGFNGNTIFDFDSFVVSIKKSIDKAQRQLNHKINDIILLSPSGQNKNFLISEKIILNGSQVENNHLRQLINSINNKYQSKIVHCFRSNFTTDQNIITDNPIGITCNILSLNAIATSISDSQLNLYKNIFSRVGVNIISIYDSSVIYYLYLKSLNLDKKNIVMIDIGFKSTKIIMIKDEKISLIKTLPLGSQFITNDFMKILNVSNDFAEKIKINHVDLDLIGKRSIEIPVWEELGKNLKRKIEHDYLKSILSSRIDELFNLVLHSIPKSKFFYSYLLTGGGSMQLNLMPYLKKKFGIDVELAEPKPVIGIPTFWNNPSIMSLFTLNELIADGSLENLSILKKNDSFSNKIWYKRFVDLL